MLKVKRIKLKNIILNLLFIDDDKLAVYNEFNNKMIITDGEVFEYLKEEEVKKKNNPLKSFLHENSSKSMTDFSLFKFKIEIKNLNKFFPIFRYLTSNKSVILAVLLDKVHIIV
ncbi:hypothetical protein ACWOFR_05130 [Carnobacterium gallinarum]|uniref:hypothetical protein n=1 Tax=Carnobacterium gallinarum TaxID=2749 RepID=UPI00055988F5|nr:hypothetical protein [Carnobacterium gallinarum]